MVFDQSFEMHTIFLWAVFTCFTPGHSPFVALFRADAEASLADAAPRSRSCAAPLAGAPSHVSACTKVASRAVASRRSDTRL